MTLPMIDFIKKRAGERIFTLGLPDSDSIKSALVQYEKVCKLILTILFRKVSFIKNNSEKSASFTEGEEEKEKTEAELKALG